MAQGFDELAAFAAVARERSFTRAGAKLGVSPSALSQTLKGLEQRLGLRLLTRTTRSVATTEAGERLLRTIAPRFEEIEQALAELSALRERPAGTVRITAGEHAARTVVQRGLAKVLPDYPDIRVEVAVDYGLVDIVAEGYDAGGPPGRTGGQGHDRPAHRSGHAHGRRGIARLLPGRPAPLSPRDLTDHNCINMRLPTYGGLFPWEFEKQGREVKVRVDGQLIFNTLRQRLDSALQGLGLAYMPEDIAAPCIASGRLVRVLEDWCPPFSGYHLYYPSRRHASPAFSLLVDALRYRGD